MTDNIQLTGANASEPLPVAKRREGSPSKRTEKTAKLICGLVARGMPFIHACSVARISTQTFCNWRNDDPDFAAAIERATARGIARRLRVIENCTMSKDLNLALRASTWYLEHCQPEFFARNRIEVSGPDGAPVAATIAVFLPQKMDSNGNGSPVVSVPALMEGGQDGND